MLRLNQRKSLRLTEIRPVSQAGIAFAKREAFSQLERGHLMNASLVEQKIKRNIAVFLTFLMLVFSVEPISSVASAHSLAAVHSAAAAQTVRRRRRHRSFWKKHRDKLTVAGSALGGAAIGGIAGGKKGAAIGSLAGAGTGALYTYKIRKRRRHRRY